MLLCQRYCKNKTLKKAIKTGQGDMNKEVKL